MFEKVLRDTRTDIRPAMDRNESHDGTARLKLLGDRIPALQVGQVLHAFLKNNTWVKVHPGGNIQHGKMEPTTVRELQ